MINDNDDSIVNDCLQKLGGLTPEVLYEELNAISPGNVLHRGYTYTTTGEGKVVRTARKLKPGQILVTHFEDGRTHSQVLRASTESIITKSVSKKNKSKSRPDDEPSLFGGNE